MIGSGELAPGMFEAAAVPRGARALLTSLRDDPLRLSVVVVVVGASALAWAAVYLASGPASMEPASPSVSAAASFAAVWVLGMVAMMFPVTVPAVLMYDRMAKLPPKRETAAPLSPLARALGAPLFLLGYLSAYAALGLAAFFALAALAERAPGLMMSAPLVGGGVLVLAGLYQLSPLKNRCLSAVHSPFGLFARGWRPGLSGAARTGFRHGGYCVGCCWALMLVMLVVGAMGLFWMAGLAVVIALERAAGAKGPLVSKVVAAGLVGAGAWLAILPPAM